MLLVTSIFNDNIRRNIKLYIHNTFQTNFSSFVTVLRQCLHYVQVLMVDDLGYISGSGVMIDSHVILTSAQHFEGYTCCQNKDIFLSSLWW